MRINNLPQYDNQVLLLCKTTTNEQIKSINQNSTKCAKMTEEAETIRNGMNGTAAGAANVHHNFSYRSKVDVPQKITNELIGTTTLAASSAANHLKQQNNNGPVLGGRLQFFKGKAKKTFFHINQVNYSFFYYYY